MVMTFARKEGVTKLLIDTTQWTGSKQYGNLD
jgi:hypothetical protein